jgi:hypothetical protein
MGELDGMTAADTLETAHKLITGDRAKQNGAMRENHRNIARLWGGYLERPLTEQDVALMMVLLKVARTKGGNFNADDYVDGAGYMAIAAELAECS